MVSRSKLPYVALILVGLALVGVAAVELTDPEYVTEVRPATEADYQRAANETGSPFAYEYSDLSPNGRDAFREALESSDGSAAVREQNVPAEFAYGDVKEQYYIAYDGEYFLLTPQGPGQFSDAVDIVSWAVAAFGAVAILVGSFDLWRTRRRSSDTEEPN